MVVKIKQIAGRAFVLALLFVFTQQIGRTQPMIEVAGSCVRVTHIDGEVLYTFNRYHHTQEDWQNVFPIRTSQSEMQLAGQYQVSDSAITFIPAFPLARGVEYVATFYAEQLAKNPNEVYLPDMRTETLQLTFRGERADGPSPRITAIYPTADVLPENLLRFHIEFSTAMTRGDAYRYIKLRDGNGIEVEKAFLIVDEELWDNEMKSLTILLDPGRIKRGLKANIEMKPPLLANQTYLLTIETGWKNLHGKGLDSVTTKKFTCAIADRALPDVKNFRLSIPQNSRDELTIDLGEFFDQVMLQDAVRILDNRGEVVAGQIHIHNQESVISFKPTHGWSNQQYEIVFNRKLEDLAGNNFNRPFDNDLNSPISKKSPSTKLTFTFRSQPR